MDEFVQLLEVLTRILWSSLKALSLDSYKHLKRTLSNIHNLNEEQIKNELFRESRNVFFLYKWLLNENSRAVHERCDYPSDYFTFLENLQIQLCLWRSGENWELVSFTLYRDVSFAGLIKKHAKNSGLYLKLEDINSDDYMNAFYATKFRLLHD